MSADFDPDHDEPLMDVRKKDNPAAAMMAHWGGFLTGFIIPIVLYIAEKDKQSLVAWHARQAFNFQMTLMVYYALCGPFACLAFVELWLVLICVGLCLLLAIFETVVAILGSISAYHGERIIVR